MWVWRGWVRMGCQAPFSLGSKPLSLNTCFQTLHLSAEFQQANRALKSTKRTPPPATMTSNAT